MFSQLSKYSVLCLILLLGLLLVFYLTNFSINSLFFSFLPFSIFILAWVYSQYKLPITDGVRGYFRIIVFLFCCLFSVKNVIMLWYYWESLDTKLMVITIIGCLPLAILIVGIVINLVGGLWLKAQIRKKEKEFRKSFRIPQDSRREGDKKD